MLVLDVPLIEKKKIKRGGGGRNHDYCRWRIRKKLVRVYLFDEIINYTFFFLQKPFEIAFPDIREMSFCLES